jgi:tetrapyrrole methylase family protein/MazG family protein
MPLLIVPLAATELGVLTLAEWDALAACDRVAFEDRAHPLAQRLSDAGVAVVSPPDDVDPARWAAEDGWGLVARPDSARIVELAKAGARVTSGPAPAPDDLSAAHAAPVVRRAAGALAGAALVMARLRSDDGCPWDREQTHESLKVHLLEEAHEVIEAIDGGLLGEALEEELGDLLLQVAFHARLAEQEGRFDIAGVSDRLTAKLVGRHPHVFGDVEVTSAGQVVSNWEAIKRSENKRPGRAGAFEGIPGTLPALLTAYKVQKRAAGLGFSADAEDARNRLERSLEDAGDPEGIGEALFWLVAMARAAGVDPEGALRKATARFVESR